MKDEDETTRALTAAAEHATSLNRLILRSVVDHAIVTLDAEGMVTSWNEGAEQILGWAEEEIVGRSGGTFFTEGDVADKRPEIEMRLAIENGRANDERWHVRKDGQRFWGSGLMMPLLPDTDPDGQAVQGPAGSGGFVKIFRDRTAEYEANSQIARLENRAALAMRRSGTIGVYDYDVRENIVVCDAVCAGMFGMEPDMAEGGASVEYFFDGVHPEDVDGLREAIDTCVRDKVDFDRIFRVTSKGPKPRWVHGQAALQLDEDGRTARLSGIAVDITAQREQTRMQDARLRFAEKVRELHDQTEIAALASKMIAETLHATRAGHGYIAGDGDTIDVRADWTTPGVASLVGRHRFSDFGEYASVLRDGESVVIDDAHNDPRVRDGAPLEAIDARALVNLPLMEGGRLKAVLFVNDTRPRRWTEPEVTFLKAIFDRTYAAMDRVRYEAERNVMTAELAHRMKNMLTIAQVVVTQSLRRASNMDAAREAIAARLNALSHAQDILTRVHHRAADIHDVVAGTMRPHGGIGERVRVEGPALALRSQPVLGLSLALHELATNAAKYGALSSEDGHIEIGWTSGEDGAFTFTWTEHGGPPVILPDAQGFGSTILNSVAGSYFNGSSGVTYDPNGVVFRIEGRIED